MPKSQNEII